MIVVAGEALVDVIPDPSGGTTSRSGGSPLNVAVGLGRLGCDVTLITELGDDPAGETIRAHLQGSGVLAEVAPAARTSTAVADLSGPDPVYDLDFSWELPADLALPRCNALHIGSLAVLTKPGRDGITDLVLQALNAHSFLSYDINLRDEPDPETSAHLTRIAAAATVVKLSDQDAALLAPGVELDLVAQSFLGERTRVVLLTRGGEGATAYTAWSEVSVPTPKVEVVDTIGAGDAFMAGLLGALADRDFAIPHDSAGLRWLLSAATEVAALSCTRAGADPLWRADLAPGWPAASGLAVTPQSK